MLKTLQNVFVSIKCSILESTSLETRGNKGALDGNINVGVLIKDKDVWYLLNKTVLYGTISGGTNGGLLLRSKWKINYRG